MTSLLLLPLLPIIYEDLRYRAIHWFWIALFAILIISLMSINWQFVFTNGVLLLCQLLGLTLYFSFKQGQATNIVNRYLGLGDVFFFLPLCFLFSPLNFVAFLIVGFVGSLLFFGFGKIFLKEKLQTIPLAAYLSIILIVIFGIVQTYSYSLTNDHYLLSQLTHLYR